MASLRGSSPASREGSPEELLTPRTKIRQLLATVESSDEDDAAQSTKTVRLASPSPTHRKTTSPHNKTSPRQTLDDNESDVEVRPRGRLASRMQGAAAQAQSKGPSSDSSMPETARERVKRMLAQEEAQAQPEIEAEETRVESNIDAENADDELPTASRRLKRRAPRDTTPETAQSPVRAESPGLFVSPTRPSPAKSNASANSESENDLPAIKSDRFKALVERKRQERLAREAVEEARKAERRAQQQKLASELSQLDSDDGNVSSITDDEGGLKLTQSARPTRKASKKAIEEMSRETQRMARSMQLAHEAKTRKRISKASLFERFNYKPVGGIQSEPKIASSSRAGTPNSDVEMEDTETPPSSPPLAPKEANAEADNVGIETGSGIDVELPRPEDTLSSSPQNLDKGKGKAPSVNHDIANTMAEKSKPRMRVKNLPTLTNDSDDEFEIILPTNHKLDAIFNNVPCKKAQESHSIQALRALAQLKSPGKENHRRSAPSGMSAGELQTYLHQKARQQAKLERDRRVEMLKAQGTVIQTTEERERQMQEVEDIVAKAREEDHKLMQQERAAAKKNGDDEADPLAWDDSEDEDFKDSADDADVEMADVELSGSEEEGDVEEEDEDEVETEGQLIDGEAEDGESEADEKDIAAPEEADDDDEEQLPAVKQRPSRNKAMVISDDEAEVDIEATPRSKTTTKHLTPGAPKTDSPVAPTSVLRSAKKTFIPGLPVHGAAGLGLTQIFAGTMDSQVSESGTPTQSVMPDFDHFPDSNFSATMDEAVDDMVLDSQRYETLKQTQGVQLDFSQSQMRNLDSLLREDLQTQMSQTIELSQDGGFQRHTPLRERFVEPPFSTVDTVNLDQEQGPPNDSPLVRRGKLRRRMQAAETDEAEISASPQKPADIDSVFSVMKDAAEREKRPRPIDNFNKKKSKANEMVVEQAEESEDEYAGLGGADGEDSDNESTGSVKELIDDAAGNDMDERKLAAFYADRERANDEKEVEKLFKDITTGMLRRKRGADYDLSDSDDGGEARRKMKRRQFSKMQKALFADERVKKMAENPGNQAFLRTIEDRGSDDEMDFLDILDTPSQKEPDSQSQGEEEQQQPQRTIPDSQPRKPLGSAVENRAPAYLRRTKDGKKPSNIGEVRETLSNLLEDPQGSVIPATEAGSDSEEEEDGPSPARSDKENQSPNPRRNRAAVVDRISLKRSGSSSASAGGSSRLAFAASTASASFKVPALLRRATTNSTLMSGSSDATSTGISGSAGGFGEEAKIKRSAGKRSGVHGFARENERRAKIEESERRRQEKRARGAEKRVGLVGGLLSKGSFE